MKKGLKWLAIIGLVLCCTGFIATYKVFNDIKSTAEELYIPIKDEKLKKREEVVDVASKEPFSVLILGVDEREDDVGRSDTIIVLTINPNLESTKMLSVPRDTYTEIVGQGFKDKINHAYAFGGIKMSKETVENLLDIPIDYVAQVNMESFVDIVDIVGGITVDNTLAFDYDGETFSTGNLELDGEKALKYVRMRYDDPAGDFGRQNRQKQVIQGVLQEAISVKTVLNYRSILKTLEDNVQMNVDFNDLFSIQKHYKNSFKNIEQLYLKNGADTMMNGIYYYVPKDSELQEIQQSLQDHLEIL